VKRLKLGEYFMFANNPWQAFGCVRKSYMFLSGYKTTILS